MDKRYSYWRFSMLLVYRKSIFYLTWEPLKACKLLLVYSTCLWRSPSQLDRYMCACVCVYVSTHVRPGVCPALQPTVVCAACHTITILQAHPSIALSFPSSTHVLKHITEMTASDVRLSPSTKGFLLYAAGGRVYHGHNKKHKYTCTRTCTTIAEYKCSFYVLLFYSKAFYSSPFYVVFYYIIVQISQQTEICRATLSIQNTSTT